MKSNNTQGNPYHDESGRFAPSSSGSSEPKHFGEDDEKGGQFTPRLNEMGFGPVGPKQQEEFDIITLDGEHLGTVKANTEEEAFEIASQQFPGLGDELSVESKQKLNEMGYEPTDLDKNHI